MAGKHKLIGFTWLFAAIILLSTLQVLAASPTDPAIYLDFDITSGNIENWTNTNYSVGSGINQNGADIAGWNSYDFTNPNGEINLGADSYLDIDSNSFTWIALVNWDATSNNVAFSKVGNSSHEGASLMYISTPQIRAAVPFDDLNTGDNPGTTNWQCQAIVYNGATTFSYFNNASSATASKTLSSAISGSSGIPLFIGGAPHQGGATDFDGQIARFAVYNYNVPGTEILDICTDWSSGNEFMPPRTITANATLNITATTLFLNNTVQSFNVTAATGGFTNTTTTGSVLLSVVAGGNNITIDVPGNYSLTFECTATFNTTTACTASGIFDNVFTFNASDVLDGSAVLSFNITAENSGFSYSQEKAASAGEIEFNLLQGYDYFFEIDATGYALQNATLEANASTNQYEFVLFPSNSIFLFFFDEETFDVILENVTVTATLGAEVFENSTTSGDMVLQNFTIGTWTLDIEADNYEPRRYFVTITSRSTQDIDVYLLNSTSANTGEFIVKDGDNANKITNATVTMAHKIGTSWVSIAQATTDAFGASYFDLVQDKEYQFTVDATGYTTKTGTFVFQTINSPYTIIMSPENVQSFTTYSGFSYSLEPDKVNVSETEFSITTSSPTGTLDWFAVQVTVNGTSLGLDNVTSSPSGGTAAVSLNLSAYNGNTIIATYFAKDVSEANPLVITRSFLVFSQTPGNYTFIEFMEVYGAQTDPDEDKLSTTTRASLTAGTAALAAAVLGYAFGGFAAMAGAMAVFAMAGVFSWIPAGVAILIVAGLAGLMLIGSRGVF